jgi:hypothetical protein
VVVGFPASAEAKLDGKTGTLATIYFRYFIEKQRLLICSNKIYFFEY